MDMMPNNARPRKTLKKPEIAQRRSVIKRKPCYMKIFSGEKGILKSCS